MKVSTRKPERTVGLDVGDRWSHLCVLDGAGEIVEESRLRTTRRAVRQRFEEFERARVVLEVGPHSPWISRLVKELDHEVIVANPRKLRLIYENDRKCDRTDAEYLARVGRMDPELLSPVVHRGESAQADPAVVRSRTALVEARTALINHARSTVKAMGARLPKCSTRSFHRVVEEHVPEELQPALLPVLDAVAELTKQIDGMEKWIKELAENEYPETHYILGHFGPDSDLRRWGQRLAERGGPSAKKRAVVAVARKLAVLLHRLWTTGEVYEPLRQHGEEPNESELQESIAA